MFSHAYLDCHALARKVARRGRKKPQEYCMKRCSIAEGGQITQRRWMHRQSIPFEMVGLCKGDRVRFAWRGEFLCFCLLRAWAAEALWKNIEKSRVKWPFRGQDADHSAKNRNCSIASQEIARSKDWKNVGSFQARAHLLSIIHWIQLWYKKVAAVQAWKLFILGCLRPVRSKV